MITFFLSLDPHISYPSLYFTREDTNWEPHQTLKVDGSSKMKYLFQIEQRYKGFLLCEKTIRRLGIPHSITEWVGVQTPI